MGRNSNAIDDQASDERQHRSSKRVLEPNRRQGAGSSESDRNEPDSRYDSRERRQETGQENDSPGQISEDVQRLAIRQAKEEVCLIQEEKVKRACETSYYNFFRVAWNQLEPRTPLKDNWHIKYLCNIFQAEIERIGNRLPKTKDLIINMPPRSTKSYLCSVMLPAWAWIDYSFIRFISTSHSSSLSTHHCRQTRDLIESQWYQNYWGDRFTMKTDQNVKGHYANEEGGTRLSTSVKGSITGFGADVIIPDDIFNPKDVISVDALAHANNYYDTTLYSRLDDQEVGIRIVVQQRVHEDDLTGHLLKKYPDDYTHICIPAETEGAIVKPDKLIKKYKFSKDSASGLFFPTRFTRSYLDRLKKAGRKFYLGQILQMPSEKEGNVYMRKDFRIYQVLPDGFDKIVQSWDMNFKEGKNLSFVCGQVWGLRKVNRYLLDEWREQVGFKKAMKAILTMKAKWPASENIWVEDKANGPAVMEMLEDDVEGLCPVTPDWGSKYGRAEATSYLVEGGNVFVPDPSLNPWVEDYLDEVTSFPNTTFNDRVDCTSQALWKMRDDDVLEQYKTLCEI